jgi:hypothetical protein
LVANQRQEARIVVPVIVLDGSLYECFLDEGTDEPTLQPTDVVPIEWGVDGGRVTWLINVVRIQALKDFAERVLSAHRDLVARAGDLVFSAMTEAHERMEKPK